MAFQVFFILLVAVYLLLLTVIGIRFTFGKTKRSIPKRQELPIDRFQGEILIDAMALEKSFDAPVLRDVSLRLRKGEILGVLGASGSGKTVLLKLLAGFLKPDKGWILFRGSDIGTMDEAHLLEIRKRISYVFQSGAVFDFLDVSNNIAYPLLEQGLTDERVIRARVEYLLDAVELEGEGSRNFDELSSGGKKQVAIARAIANDPEVILYDEPTTGVDPIIGKALSRLIRKLNRQEKMSSVVVTHDLKCMEIVADRIILLKDGRIRFEGDLDALSQSSDPYVRAFIAGKRYREGEFQTA